MESTKNWLYDAFGGIVAFVPNLLAGLVILLIGYVIAKVLARITRSVAPKLGFDRLIGRLGLTRATDAPHAASRWAGTAVFVLVMLVTLIQSARALQLVSVAEGLERVVAYLPHVLAAGLVFGAALFVGNRVRDRLIGARAREASTYGTIRMLPSVARGVIIGAGAFMALRELQIAPEIVNLAFMLSLGAVAVAVALAFGLGGRDVAKKVAESWYARRSRGPRVGTTDVPQAPPTSDPHFHAT